MKSVPKEKYIIFQGLWSDMRKYIFIIYTTKDMETVRFCICLHLTDSLSIYRRLEEIYNEFKESKIYKKYEKNIHIYPYLRYFGHEEFDELIGIEMYGKIEDIYKFIEELIEEKVLKINNKTRDDIEKFLAGLLVY